MDILIDTPALLWWLGEDPQLREEARNAISSPANVCWVSAATAWEMSIKKAAGKLESPDDLVETLSASGIRPLPITIEHAIAAGELPRQHGDPFDRLLIAQAMAEGLTIVTRDERFRDYDVALLDA